MWLITSICYRIIICAAHMIETQSKKTIFASNKSLRKCSQFIPLHKSRAVKMNWLKHIEELQNISPPPETS